MSLFTCSRSQIAIWCPPTAVGKVAVATCFFFLGGGREKGHDTNSLLGKYQWEVNFSSVFSLSFPLFVGLSKITFLEPKLTPENRIRIPWWNHQSGRCFLQTGTFVSPIYPGGTDHIICPVPAHSKFAPFSQQAGTLRAGKVWAGFWVVFLMLFPFYVWSFLRFNMMCWLFLKASWDLFDGFYMFLNANFLHVCHERTTHFGCKTNPPPWNVAPECVIQLRIVFLNH